MEHEVKGVYVCLYKQYAILENYFVRGPFVITNLTYSNVERKILSLLLYFIKHRICSTLS